MTDRLETLIADVLVAYAVDPEGGKVRRALGDHADAEAATVVAALRAAPADMLAEGLGMEQVGWWHPITGSVWTPAEWQRAAFKTPGEPVYRFVERAASGSHDTTGDDDGRG